MSGRLFTNNEILFLKEKYPSNGCNYCARVLNRSKKSIYAKCFELKIEFIPREVININLDKLNTEMGAYVLGFLWADGHITKEKKYIVCKVASKDGFNLEKIFKFTGNWTVKLRRVKNRQLSMILSVWDKNFHEFLTKMDYKEKSIKTPSKIIQFIDKEYHNYFWRGYFDGDGSLSISDEDNYALNFSGSFDQEWKDLISQLNKLNIKYYYLRKKTKCGNSSVITLTNFQNILTFCNYIYNGKNFGLKRKFRRYLKYIEKITNFYQDDRGIYYNKTIKKYIAELWIKKIKKYLGSFVKKEDAIKCRNDYAKKIKSKEFLIKGLLLESKNNIFNYFLSQKFHSQ